MTIQTGSTGHLRRARYPALSAASLPKLYTAHIHTKAEPHIDRPYIYIPAHWSKEKAGTRRYETPLREGYGYLYFTHSLVRMATRRIVSRPT